MNENKYDHLNNIELMCEYERIEELHNSGDYQINELELLEIEFNRRGIEVNKK